MNGHHNPRNRRQNILILLIMMSVVVLAAAAFFLHDKKPEVPEVSKEDPYAGDTGMITYFGGQPYRRKAGLETLLVIGLDKTADDAKQEDSYRNTQQADFLMLMVFDKKNENLSVLQINRDTMSDIWQLDVTGRPIDTFEGQLALSHTYGATEAERCQYTIRAVSKFLYNTQIDHYISFTMDAVPVVNDSCGGVTLELMDDFPELGSAGTVVTLHGEQALQYVRARREMANPTNLHRMERQRQYLDELTKLLRQKAEEDSNYVQDTVSSVKEYLHSDCTVFQLSKYAEYALEETYGGIQTISGESIPGEEFMEFYPDEEELQKQIIQIFYEPVE